MSAPFKTDDRYSIELNALIRDTKHLPEIFQRGYFGDQSYYRPFVYVSYMAEHALFGDNPFFYYLDNVLLHLLCAFLAWKIADKLFGNHRFGFWVGFLFAIHPIHWEAVANIPGRAVILSTLFSLFAFYAWIMTLQKRSMIWLGVATLSFIFALLSKESAGVLPGIFCMYWLCFQRAQISLRKTVFYLLPFVTVIIFYIVLRHTLHIDVIAGWPTLSQRILGFISFLRSAITHLRLMIVPVGLYFDRSQALYVSFHNLEVWCVVGFWMFVSTGIWVRRRYLTPVDMFCLAWLMMDVFPVSQIVSSIGVSPGYISAADHFLYMLSIPFLILLVRLMGVLRSTQFFHQLIGHLSSRIIVFGCVAFLMILNVQQNIYAHDEMTMLERSFEYQPYNSRLQNLAGYLSAMDHDYKNAQKHFEWAVKADPFNPSSRISLGKTYCDLGFLGECLMQYLSVLDPESFAELLRQNIQYPVGKIAEKIQKKQKLSQAESMSWEIYQSRIQK